MAILALHFPVGEISPAKRLRAMLATVETKADFSAWSGDYMEYADQLSVSDQRALVKMAVDHSRAIGRAA